MNFPILKVRSMELYLVTGVAGFIGSRVASMIIERGDRVVGIDNVNDSYSTEIKEHRLELLQKYHAFTFIQMDLSDLINLDKDVGSLEIAAVVHLAARAGVRQSVLNPSMYLESNVIGTLNVLEFIRRQNISKFILASTSSVYGRNESQPVRETGESSFALSPYAASKKAAEVLTHTYHHLYGINASILRFFTVYGPRGRPDMSIFKFMRAIVEGESLTLFGDGGKRDFTYIDDTAIGVLKSLELRGFNIINLGSDRPIAVVDVIRMIEECAGQVASVTVLERDPSDVLSTWADISKAKNLLGWEPTVSIKEGIKETYDWYVENREWAKSITG